MSGKAGRVKKCSGQPCRTGRKFENKFIYLTNRFHVALCLFSNRSKLTSKYGRSKNVAHEAIAEYVTDVLTTF